jgi:alpha-glucosidase (family GH31 glycosyl hydrolase)
MARLLGAAFVGALLATSVGTASAATGDDVSITAPGGGYRLTLNTQRLGLTTVREGHPVLSTAADAFTFDGGTATEVHSTHVSGDTLHAVATSTAGRQVDLTVTLHPDRYDLTWSVAGATGDRAVHYDLASAGHWYGGGETSEGKPQPFPLSAGSVDEPEFSPASYMMQEPYFYTSKSVGVYVRTQQPMRVGINAKNDHRADLTVTGAADYSSTVFVERSRKAVYDDYIGVVGKPERSTATDEEFTKPVWNSWAQFYRNIDQAKVLEWAHSLKDAGIDGHTVQLDDKWESNYGNLTFDAKTFPDPKAMSDEIHAMGQKSACGPPSGSTSTHGTTAMHASTAIS